MYKYSCNHISSTKPARGIMIHVSVLGCPARILLCHCVMIGKSGKTAGKARCECAYFIRNYVMLEDLFNVLTLVTRYLHMQGLKE